MKLDLTDKQKKSLLKGKSIQLKHGQIGSGMAISLHPMIEKKLLQAHRSGKGMRLNLSGGELEAMGGSFFGSLKKAVTKTANKAVNSADKWAKKNLTEKNVAKLALKEYNNVNKELEKHGMPSIHGAILNEGLGYVPFVPSTLKDMAGNYAEKKIDRALAKETAKRGAGIMKTVNRGLKKAGIKKDVHYLANQVNKKNVKKALNYANSKLKANGYDNVEDVVARNLTKNKQAQGLMKDVLADSLEGGRLVNPYIPSAYLTKQSGSGLSRGGKLPISAGSSKVFDDHKNVLREGQAGFKADVSFDPLVNGDVFKSKKKTGAGFRISGEGFSVHGEGLKKRRGRPRKLM